MADAMSSYGSIILSRLHLPLCVCISSSCSSSLYIHFSILISSCDCCELNRWFLQLFSELCSMFCPYHGASKWDGSLLLTGIVIDVLWAMRRFIQDGRWSRLVLAIGQMSICRVIDSLRGRHVLFLRRRSGICLGVPSHRRCSTLGLRL